MGWAIANACSNKGCERSTPTNYLEILVSSTNQNAIAQIEKFMKYVEENISGLFKNVRYVNIKNIQIRHFDKAGKMNEVYKGEDLNEDKYENIISKIR